MKHSNQVTITGRQKSKRQKKTPKASASIAQRYMELRRLRERLSEVELSRTTR